MSNICILKLKCTKSDLGWDSARPHLGSLQRSPDPLAGFLRGLLVNEGEEPERRGKDGKKGRLGRGGEGSGWEGGRVPTSSILL